MENCRYLIDELKEYKFKAKSSESSGWDDKPEDKNNHAINPLEWIVMELPADPKHLIYGVYNKQGEDISKPKITDDALRAIYALSDDLEMEDDNSWI
jgi:hypothetical protein